MTDSREPRGPTLSGDHLDDGQLLSIVDDGSHDRSIVEAHLRGCPLCQSRLDVIGRASTRFSDAVTLLPSPSIDPRVRQTIARHARPRAASRWAAYPMVAAATILLIASAALASPVRLWIVRTLARHEPTPILRTGTVPPSTTSRGSGAITVSFAASDSVLVVHVATLQAAGVLEIVRSDGPSISARITAGGVNEELLIAPGMLRIRNEVTSRADYRVAVPPTVEIIRLTIGASIERTIVVGPATHESIPLTAQR